MCVIINGFTFESKIKRVLTMNKISFPLISAWLVLILWSPSIGQVITEITGESSNDQAILEWTTGSEIEVVEFKIQRSFDGVEFHTVKYVEPVGSRHTYRYIDDDLFKERLHTYYYRIETVLSGNRSELTRIIEVILSFSTIRRTWGSIKAMFR